MSAQARAARTRTFWTGTAVLPALACLALAACATAPARGPAAGTEGQRTSRYSGYKVGRPYQVHGVWYYPKAQPNYDEIGIASWYGYQFHNQYTADGEVFDMNLPSAAHKTLPLPSLVEVTNLANGKKLVVRVNDRGPFVDGRIIDLSKEAAAELGFVAAGVTKVRVRYIGEAPDPPASEPRQQIASARRPTPGPAPRPVDPDRQPQSPIPYAQLAQSRPAPAPPPAAVPAPAAAPAAALALAATAAPTTAPAALPGPPLPEVDALLAANPPAAPVAPAATYDLQAGTFATEDAARRFAASLTGGGLPEVQAVHDGPQLSWRVVVHGLASPAEAAAAESQAMALGATRAEVVRGS